MSNTTNFKNFIKAAASHFNNYEVSQLVTHTDRYARGGVQIHSGCETHKYTFFGVALDKSDVISALETHNIVQSDTIKVTWGVYESLDVLDIEIVV